MATAIVFLPLLAAIIVGLFGRTLGDRVSQLVTTGSVLAAAVLSVLVFKDVALDHHTSTVTLLNWIDTGPLSVDWAIRLDTLTAVMLIVVTGVSSIDRKSTRLNSSHSQISYA